MQTDTPLDITNCDREPIHIPGSIQPRGCLIACDVSATVILRHSQNMAEILGLEDAVFVDQKLDAILGPSVAHDLRNALSTALEPSRPSLIVGMVLPWNGARVDVSAHIHKGTAILEFEPVRNEAPQAPLELARALIGRLKQATSTDDLIRRTTRPLQALLGYDRVMVYRFAHDGSGKVVGEARRPGLESFLGQHFPASDIPKQARLLYLQNTLRSIADANADRVPLIPQFDASGEPLDLSFAHLRSVSPIHCEYLRNMGVSASMSISIIVGGQLWGLIACHHYAPHILTLPQRISAEMFGEFFSLHLEALTQRDKLETAFSARRALDVLLRDAAHASDLGEALRIRIDELKTLVDCDGVGIWFNGSWSSNGLTPPPAAAQGIARFMASLVDGAVWATHSLSRHLPSAAAYRDVASGVLAVPLSQRPRDYLFFFRPEVVQTLEWAGDPNKTYETGPQGDRLTPRKSFAIWKQTVEGQAIPWSDTEREIAETTRAALVEIVLRNSELLQEERAKADVRQRMLNEELNHRVKNILAIIKSLVSHPVEAGRTLEDFVGSLKSRIQALAFAHDQVVRGAGGGSLLSLLDAELSPYRTTDDAVRLEGPPIALDARAFSVMALVLHELATNAAKYGGLSRPGGRVRVVWRRSEAGGCEIDWSESGGPEVHAPRRAGFGTVLTDRAVPHDLGGESTVRYDPDGVKAHFYIPTRHISALPMETRVTKATTKKRAAAMTTALAGLRMLVLEDQLLVAMSVEGMLMDFGADSVETASSTEDARRRLKDFTPDAAVLDLNLGPELSVPIAEVLFARGIPFVFATGYGEAQMIPEHMRDILVVRKPYVGEAIAEAVEAAVRLSQVEK